MKQPLLRRTRILSVIACCLTSAFCVAEHAPPGFRPHISEQAEPHPGLECKDNAFDFTRSSPADFLTFLKSIVSDSRTRIPMFSVHCVHKGWILNDDIPGLLALMDSTEPCASVAMAISSYIDTEPSTVGNEAAFLVMGYQKGEYPPALNSNYPSISAGYKKALRQWWAESQKYR